MARVRRQTRLTCSSVAIVVATVKWSNEKSVAWLPDNDDVGVFVGGIVLFQEVKQGGSAFPAILKLVFHSFHSLGVGVGWRCNFGLQEMANNVYRLNKTYLSGLSYQRYASVSDYGRTPSDPTGYHAVRAKLVSR